MISQKQAEILFWIFSTKRRTKIIKPSALNQKENTVLLRRSGRAVYLYSTAHKTQLTILQLEDSLPTSLFLDLLPQPIGRFINNIFRELNVTTKLIINTMSPQFWHLKSKKIFISWHYPFNVVEKRFFLAFFLWFCLHTCKIYFYNSFLQWIFYCEEYCWGTRLSNHSWARERWPPRWGRSPPPPPPSSAASTTGTSFKHRQPFDTGFWQYRMFWPVLGIRGILVRIRVPGS